MLPDNWYSDIRWLALSKYKRFFLDGRFDIDDIQNDTAVRVLGSESRGHGWNPARGAWSTWLVRVIWSSLSLAIKKSRNRVQTCELTVDIIGETCRTVHEVSLVDWTVAQEMLEWEMQYFTKRTGRGLEPQARVSGTQTRAEVASKETDGVSG
jgi:DNA-directed RNA polymerase specialized sigma24 family protein